MTKTISKAIALVMAVICMFSFSIIGSAANNYISADEAKQAAVDAVNAKFGTSYTVSGVTFEDYFYAAEYDDDYMCATYDISFYVDNGNGTYTEYDVDIDAETGAVKGNIDSEIENGRPSGPASSGSFIDYIKNIIASFINYLKNIFGIA